MRADFLVLPVLSLLAFLSATFFALASLALAVVALALSAFDWVVLVVCELGASGRKSIVLAGGRGETVSSSELE